MAAQETRVRKPGESALADASAIEQEYLEHREAVLAMLHSEFPRLPERDELYHEAWVELLTLRATGETIDNTRALLKSIARRRATDQWRKHKPDYVDPTGVGFTNAVDAAPLPDEHVVREIEHAVLRHVIDALDPREAAIIKLRYDVGLTAQEIAERLELKKHVVEKTLSASYQHVFDQLYAPAGEDSPWLRRQRSLLVACELGIASRLQRRRAQQMVEQDPRCRTMLREVRAALRDVAAALPLPPAAVLEQRQGRRAEAAFGWFDDLRGSARAATNHVVSRLPGTSGSGEAVAAGSGMLGAGAAAKAVLACLAIGGTAAVCTSALTDADGDKTNRPPAPRAAVEKTIEPLRTRVVAVTTPKPPPRAKPKPKTRPPRQASSTTAASTGTNAPVSSPRYVTPPSPAPTGSTEFGPGTVGSGPAASAPAAAPTDGGGEFTP